MILPHIPPCRLERELTEMTIDQTPDYALGMYRVVWAERDKIEVDCKISYFLMLPSRFQSPESASSKRERPTHTCPSSSSGP